MAEAAIINNRKPAISPQTFDRSARNLARWRILAFPIGPVGKIRTFKNPRWRTAAILNNQKRPYLRKSLSDRHEIWHVDAHRPSKQVYQLKNSTFKNPRWRTPPTWKKWKTALNHSFKDRNKCILLIPELCVFFVFFYFYVLHNLFRAASTSTCKCCNFLCSLQLLKFALHCGVDAACNIRCSEWETIYNLWDGVLMMSVLDQDVDTQELLAVASAMVRERFGIHECTFQMEHYVSEMGDCTQCRELSDWCCFRA